MKILILGVGGRMGHEVARLAQAGNICAYGVDPAGCAELPTVRTLAEAAWDVDCIVDFSHHDATEALLSYARRRHLPAVIATTGQTPEQLDAIRAASSEIPIFRSANMSVGVALIRELARIAAKMMPTAEIEIVEAHHDRKLDAPSGTALMLADAICAVRPNAYPVCGRNGSGKRTPDEIGIHAIRMGNIVGEHEIFFGTDTQTVSIRHSAHDRALFAEGALAAASFLVNRPAGLYDMDDLMRASRN